MTEDDAVGSAFELPDGTRVGQRYPASSTDSPVIDIKLPGERKNITVRVNPDADAPADEPDAPTSEASEHDSAAPRPDDLSSDANRAVAARLLLDELLQDMSDDVVPLSNLDSMTAYDYPSASIAEKQAVVLSTIRSMLESGNVIVGHVVGGSEAYVDPWNVTVVQAMEVLHDWYVTHHDEPATWEWTTWFALNSAEHDQPSAVHSRIRGELLWSMDGDVLPFSDVEAIVSNAYPPADLTTRQSRVLEAVRMMLADGLLTIGTVTGGSDAYVTPWELTLDQAMDRLHERYVINHDDPHAWEWTTWFALTEEGRQAAKSVEPPSSG